MYTYINFRADKRSCKAQGGPLALIFTAHNQIRQLCTHNRSLNLLFSEDTPKITGLDVSTATGYVYFTIAETGTVHSLNLRNRSKYYISGMGEPDKLAVDWISHHIYFADSASKSIKLCNFLEEKCATIHYFDKEGKVSALTVDPVNKYIFYAVVNWWLFNTPMYQLYRTDLDGSNLTELIKPNKGLISGITYDSYKRILYYMETKNGSIQMLKYDSINPTTIVSGLSKPTTLQLFENHLYYFAAPRRFGKCSLYGERRHCEDRSFSVDANELFVLSQESRQMKSLEVCAEHNCSYLCVPAAEGARCICANGHRVEEGEECLKSEVSIKHYLSYFYLYVFLLLVFLNVMYLVFLKV